MDGIPRGDFLCVTKVSTGCGKEGVPSLTHRVKGCYKRYLAGGGWLIVAAKFILMSVHCCIFLLVIS